MERNYSNKNLTELELGNIEFYLNNNCYLFIFIHSIVSFMVSFIFLFFKFSSFLDFSLLKLELEDNVYNEYFVKRGVCFFKL